jgi:hypothetical protein
LTEVLRLEDGEVQTQVRWYSRDIYVHPL